MHRTMRDLQYLLTILYFQNSLCTIDISVPEYQYLSRSLTPEECKRLYASLHSTTFNLPAEAAEKNVPDISCLQLLTKWDKGTNKWEGRTKSHVDVVKRLRQIGRDDLAEWLSSIVFRKLEKAVNVALDAKFSNMTEEVQVKTNTDKSIDDWTVYNTMTWAVIAGIVTSAVLILGRVISICCRKRVLKKKAKEEEIMELLSYGTLDSDQETIYECVLKNNRTSENKKVTE